MSSEEKRAIAKIAADVKTIKNSLPNRDIDRLEEAVLSVTHKVDDLCDKIMDPQSGLIVSVGKNTGFRRECEPERKEVLDNFHAVLRWKTTIDRALWVLFSGFVGIIIKLLFFR